MPSLRLSHHSGHEQVSLIGGGINEGITSPLSWGNVRIIGRMIRFLRNIPTDVRKDKQCVALSVTHRPQA